MLSCRNKLSPRSSIAEWFVIPTWDGELTQLLPCHVTWEAVCARCLCLFNLFDKWGQFLPGRPVTGCKPGHNADVLFKTQACKNTPEHKKTHELIHNLLKNCYFIIQPYYEYLCILYYLYNLLSTKIKYTPLFHVKHSPGFDSFPWLPIPASCHSHGRPGLSSLPLVLTRPSLASYSYLGSELA